MLTRKQHELLTFIQLRLEESGISPSFEEMKEALDLKSKSGVHRLISALEERGFIRQALRAGQLMAMGPSRAPHGAVARQQVKCGVTWLKSFAHVATSCTGRTPLCMRHRCA